MKKLLQNDGKPVNGTIVQGAFGSLLPMLKANQADMAMDIEPMVSIAVKDGAHIVYSPAKVLGDFAFTGLTVSDEYHKKNPETIKKVVRALARAMQFIHTDIKGAIQVAASEFPEVPPEVVSEGINRLVAQGTIPGTPQLSEEAWKAAITLRKEIGDLKGEGSFAENVDPEFALEIMREPGSQEKSTKNDVTGGGGTADGTGDSGSTDSGGTNQK
jgi:ABC-type nitrate/sulfonate/bicarbonate transport system substrate-binding protein